MGAEMNNVIKVHGAINNIPFRSQLEETCWNEWLPTIDHLSAYYEPVTLRMEGGNYTPDFAIVMPDMTLVYVEVKGSWKARGGALSRKRLRQAADEYAWMGNFVAVLPAKTRRKAGKMIVTDWIIEKYGAWDGEMELETMESE